MMNICIMTSGRIHTICETLLYSHEIYLQVAKCSTVQQDYVYFKVDLKYILA